MESFKVFYEQYLLEQKQADRLINFLTPKDLEKAVREVQFIRNKNKLVYNADVINAIFKINPNNDKNITLKRLAGWLFGSTNFAKGVSAESYLENTTLEELLDQIHSKTYSHYGPTLKPSVQKGIAQLIYNAQKKAGILGKIKSRLQKAGKISSKIKSATTPLRGFYQS